jgi:hypothetical protein
MTTKADFNADEWSTVVQGPLLAGMRIVLADRGGVIRESLAMGKAYQEARGRQGQSQLLDELVASPPALDAGALPNGADMEQHATAGISEAVAIVNAKATPEEAEAYKQFILSIADTVANASKEGGFLGIGGKKVSPAEQAALDGLQAELA